MKSIFLKLYIAFTILFSVHISFASTVVDSTPPYLSYEQRWFLSYLIHGSGQPKDIQKEVLQKMSQFLIAQSEKSHKVKVQDFNQFLTLFRGDWPKSHKVEKDLQILEMRGIKGFPIYFSESPDVQKQIDEYLKLQKLYISSQFPGATGEMLSAVSEVQGPGFIQQNPKLAKRLFSRFEKVMLEDGFNSVQSLIQEKFKEIAKSGEALASSNIDDRSNDIKAQKQLTVTEGFRKFISFVLKEYFINLNYDFQKQIVNSLLGESLQASQLTQFEVMVMNSGPQFQKLLQIVASSNDIGDELLSVFKKLESKVMPVPPEIVQEIVSRIIDDYSITEYSQKPLGTGTMAQVHLGKRINEKGDSEQIVIRFLKPDIEERVDEDHRILKLIAPKIDSNPEFQELGFPKLGKLADELTHTVKDELVVSDTIERQEAGALAYNRVVQIKSGTEKVLLRINVPKVIKGKKFHPEIMVQEYVAGSKLEKIKGNKVEIIEFVAKMWIEELFFNSGFFHSDLHQGNMLVDAQNNKINVQILDFGMGGTLSKEEKGLFLLLSAGDELKDFDMIVSALWGLSSKEENQIRYDELENDVARKLYRNRLTNHRSSTDEWLSYGTERGLKFPAKTVGVSRGLIILEKLLANTGSRYNINQISEQVAKKNFYQFQSSLRETNKFKFLDFFRLINASFKNKKPQSVLYCRQIFAGG